MTFFVDGPNTYRSVNNKGQEFNEWAGVYKHFLIPSQLSLDAFIEEIRYEAGLLDEKFPRSTKLKVDVTSISGNGLYIQVYPEKTPEKLVFTMTIHQIRGTFDFYEPAPVPQLEKGGRNGNT